MFYLESFLAICLLIFIILYTIKISIFIIDNYLLPNDEIIIDVLIIYYLVNFLFD